ncbi:MAG: hypothetical protein H0U00_00275 [Actinobacteria bacterium]|nr:hypothetical protein [Actinomycetota bacterium]
MTTPLLVLVFAGGAVAIWVAGVALSKTTSALDSRLGLGEELGGLLLLAVAGSLPEVAITVSAAVEGHLDIAAGNLIGGIAVQTMVLVVCDIASGRERPLTFLVGALTPVLEGMLVVLVISAVLMGSLLEPSTAIGGVVSPASIAIVALWLVGIYVINRVRKSPRWSVSMPGARPGRRHRRESHSEKPHPFAALSTLQIAAIFVGACAVTLVGRGRARDERERARGPRRHQRRHLRRHRARDGDGPARDQLRDRSGPARRQRARDGRHLWRQRVPGLPVPSC